MVFEGVTKEDLTEIEKARDDHSSMGPSVRMTHFADRALLIVKLMPSIKLETPHRSLGEDMIRALVRMGTPDRELTAVGAGKYETPASSKQGDSAWKPKVFRGGPDDWPTIVIECGLSGSLARLRGDASWWLSRSNGDVKIVVLISITRAQKRLRIERWCLAPPARYGPDTRITSECEFPSSHESLRHRHHTQPRCSTHHPAHCALYGRRCSACSPIQRYISPSAHGARA
ncbi:hypothetical protein VTN02DRAFT_5884 [Thermoascus thermophilus]